jgi:endonuclease YncB( thermonuclease family)
VGGKKRLTAKWLRQIGTPRVLIPGIILAGVLGWPGWKNLGPDYYASKQVFPDTGMVRNIVDGDTFELQNGNEIRLIGINAPERGEVGYEEAIEVLSHQVIEKKLWFEYDRYQDDKFGRVLAWVWIDCEAKPKFTPPEYMHKSKRESNPGLTENPEGCKKGKLLNEEMVKAGLARTVKYKDRGELKYEKRIMGN